MKTTDKLKDGLPDFKNQDLHVAWKVQYVVSLRRESVKSTDSGSLTGVKSVRPTWFQDTTGPFFSVQEAKAAI